MTSLTNIQQRAKDKKTENTEGRKDGKTERQLYYRGPLNISLEFRQKDRKTKRQKTERRKDGKTKRQKDKKTERQKDGKTKRHRKDRKMEIQRDK